MRDQLVHHYFDTDHAIVTEAVTERLPALREAVERLIGSASEFRSREGPQISGVA